MSLRDMLKQTLFEEPIKPPKATPPQTTPLPNPIQEPTAPVTPVVDYNPTTTIDTENSGNNPAYVRLKSKADFKQTSTYQLLQKYLQPMQDMAIPEQMKYSLAIKQIKQIENVDSSSLLTVFDGLKSKLTEEQSKFDSSIQQAIDTKVKPVAAQIDSVNSEIADLRKQIEDRNVLLMSLTSQQVEATAKIDKAKSQFAIAFQIISSEIEGDRTRYAGLLQG